MHQKDDFLSGIFSHRKAEHSLLQMHSKYFSAENFARLIASMAEAMANSLQAAKIAIEEELKNKEKELREKIEQENRKVEEEAKKIREEKEDDARKWVAEHGSKYCRDLLENGFGGWFGQACHERNQEIVDGYFVTDGDTDFIPVEYPSSAVIDFYVGLLKTARQHVDVLQSRVVKRNDRDELNVEICYSGFGGHQQKVYVVVGVDGDDMS